MRRYLLLVLCFAVLPAIACTTKKDRLTVDTLTIAIDPNVVAVSTGAAKNLTAICKSAKSNNVSIAPVWSVDSNLGTFSPSSGKTTTFTAGRTVGTGKIYATYSGIIGKASVSVSSTAPVGIGTATQPYGIYSETYTSPMLKYDTANPPDTDGGCMGLYGSFIANVNDDTGAGNFTEGTKGLKCSAVGSPGGLWIQFGSDSTPGYGIDARVQKDMSAYSGGMLKFDIKMTADVTVGIEWGALGAGKSTKSYKLNVDLGYLADNSWQSITIPLLNFTSDLTQLQVPISFWANTGTVFYVDNIRWTPN